MDEPLAPGSLPATAAETAPDAPWPLRVLSENLKRYFERAPQAWIEGQLIEFKVIRGNAWMTLRDLDADLVKFSVVAGQRIGFDVDGDGATGRWYLEDRVISEEWRFVLEGAAFYEDRYVRTAGGWRVAHTGYRRTFEMTYDLADLPGGAGRFKAHAVGVKATVAVHHGYERFHGRRQPIESV